jgi:hypothetical protein
METTRRAGPILLVLLLLFQSFAILSVSANPTGGTISTFDGGQANPSISTVAGQFDTSLGIEVPRNVTFDSVSFVVNVKDEAATPGQVYIDIGQDGVKEWAFEGLGYGTLGHQNSFLSGNGSDDFLSTGIASSTPIFIPYASSIDDVALNVTFSPSVNGGLIPLGPVDDYTSGDIDNDTRDELAILSTDSSSTGFNAAVTRLDWDPATGINVSSWVATCAGATKIAMADFNKDGMEDIATFAYGSDLACVHLSNATGIGAAQPVALYSNSIAADLGDFNHDGSADIVSIHSGGTFALRAYNAKVGSFGANQTQTVNANNTATPTTLSYLTAGAFGSNNSTFSVVVTDLFAHSTPLGWVNGSGITESPYSFDGIGSQPIAGDIDSDGDIDFIGQNQQGYTIALNTGLQWNTTDVLATSELATASALTNASVFDHDGDGVNSLIVPNPSTSDGYAQTIDGNLTVYSLNSTQIGNISAVLQPWSIPTNAQAVDLDGDGVLEHIVPAGDATHGLFIGAYNSISMDVNSDGQMDLHSTGYAGAAQYGMSGLVIEDPLGNMTTLLSPMMNALPYTTDGFGIRLSAVSFDFANTATGTFYLDNLDIGYDIDFIVENNPFSAGNLTNIINQQQTIGTGNFVVPLPVNATESGVFTVSGLLAQYSPGAPNLSIPPTPIVTVTELTSERVQLEWQDIIDFGEDLIGFEVFRTTQGGTFDLTSPQSTDSSNMTLDGEVEHGSTYVYGVRSLHAFGVTSNMSTPTTVTVPFPSPPAAVAGFVFMDTPDDTGESLDMVWDISIDGAMEYRVYFESQVIDSIEELEPVATIAHSTAAQTMSLSTLTLGLTLEEGAGYYAAVVAFDEYGNSTTSFSTLGPVVALNNSMRASLIEVDLSTTGAFENDEFGFSALDAVYLNVTLSSGGEVIAGQALSLHIHSSEETISLSGITDADGVWQAIAVEDLTELGGTIITLFDSVSMTIDYSGTTGSSTMQPIAPTNLTLQGLGLLRANVSTDGASIELSEAGVYELEVDFAAELPTQNTYLEGLVYTWEQQNASGYTTSSGAIEIKGGQLILSGTANRTDTLTLTLDETKSWIVPSTNPIVFTFTGGPNDGTNSTNDTGGNTTDGNTTEPTLPDAALPATVECQTETYTWEDTNADLAFTCVVTNPNPFSVSASFALTTPSTTTAPVSFDVVAGGQTQSSAIASFPIEAGSTYTLTLTPVRNAPSDGLFPGEQGEAYTVILTCSDSTVGPAQASCSTMTAPTASMEGQFTWILGEQPEVQDPAVTPSDDTKSNTGIIVGGVLGLIALIVGAGAIVVLRNGDEEEDDWYTETTDDEPEVVEKPSNPSSKSLDELQEEGRSLEDIEGPKEHRPSLFDEFDNSTVESHDAYESESFDMDAALQEELPEAEADDGISVDENGTEWWEDEEGVWWYREEGWEDWAVWED